MADESPSRVAGFDLTPSGVRVKELQPMFKGEHVVVLHNGRQLPMTRGLREVEQALKFGYS